MFLKQTAYKPRSGSQSSQGGSGGQQAENKSASPPPKAEATPRKSTDVVPGAISAAAAGRRRSSAGQYAGLTQYKRTSQDASAAERKAAWSEQKATGGVLGSMWNNFTKGGTS